MKRLLLASILMVGLVESLLAQQPMPQSPPGSQPAAGLPAPALAVTSPTAYPLVDGGDSACVPLKTICVAEPTTKVTITPLYSKVCEPLCLPKCSLFSSTGCCDGGCGRCMHPRNKYYLVVRPCKEERPAVVCKPVLVPACPAPAACASAPACSETGPAAVVPAPGVPASPAR